MKLSECTMGTLVIEKRIPGGSHTEPLRIGHVAGLAVSAIGETIPVIQFAKPYRSFACEAIPNPPVEHHHGNLDKLVD